MKFQRRPFTPDVSYVAMRPFTMNGVIYRHDDPVDVRGIEPRRLRQMYDARLIDPSPPEAPQGAPTGKARVTPAAAPKVVQTPPQAAPQAEAAFGFRLEHKGFGKYVVLDAAGDTVAGPLPKETADRELERLSATLR